MKPPQDPVCKEPETFPATIYNRAALDRIAYRIGDYASARRWLLEQLDRSSQLVAWTYRGADDPGIALYEGAALLIDSLTFYQQAYANEAYLRTASWHESVADLVRLVGYRLQPAIGGTGTFAFEVSGDKPVTIPRGVALQARLAPADQQADFETSEQIQALPWLSKLTLVRPQLPLFITTGMTKLVVALGTPLTFDKNDRIAIGVASADGKRLDSFEVVIVDSVETWHGRSVLTLKGPITKVTGLHSTLTAVKLGQTFHLTGHNAPTSYVTVDSAGDPHGHTLTFMRRVDLDFDVSDPVQAINELALEPQAPDLALGTRVAIQISTSAMFDPNVLDPSVLDRIAMMSVRAIRRRVHTKGAAIARFELANVVDARAVTVAYGPLSIPSTILKLDRRIASDLAGGHLFDIRAAQVDTIVGAPFTVGPVWKDAPAPKTHLVYWGPTSHALDLKDRRIGIAPPGKPSYMATAIDVQPIGDRATVILDREVDFADFVDGNKTAVFGNLADVTEGKRADEAVIGSGDDRVAFQSFQLPKQPLTYLERAGATPPVQPEIEIVVSGRIWKHVPVLFGETADAQVYIVRQDDDANSWVQFGDGKTGARLPSGVDNVVVRYRTGAGAYGPLAEDAKATADRTVKQVTAANLVGLIAGGSAAEDETTAKLAAPARVQSLDRIVSITDVEGEALAIGGVARARALWTIDHGMPVVQVTLLMQAGRTAELDEASAVLAVANRTRGPQRFPIVVVPGAFEYVYLDLAIAIDPTFDPRPVRDAVAAALGVTGMANIDGKTGLLGERSRRTFGDAEYATRIEGVAQNVPGVEWALVHAFGSLGVADDPAVLTYPAIATRAETVPCLSTHVLRLFSATENGPFRLRTVSGGA